MFIGHRGSLIYLGNRPEVIGVVSRSIERIQHRCRPTAANKGSVIYSAFSRAEIYAYTDDNNIP